MTERSRHYFYKHWYVFFRLMTPEQCQSVLLAIGEYFCNGNLTEFNETIPRECFLQIISELDADMVAYEKKCAVNAENGKKGGRPPKEKAENYDGLTPYERKFGTS